MRKSDPFLQEKLWEQRREFVKQLKKNEAKTRSTENKTKKEG